ncbi:MAG: RNA 2'-phosphotransferase [Candidatus Marinimicrobia bacterium]|nr:RNA 2'-phosphotransferase [Candidatus Neomarinimicrobiota bacterium]MCF7828352.1 RNA 2'-phosphotransferase [Candidatus Neomarinimicrobiota bacterium]MCF7881055.1 RNA 2'-phosphotransferase [Candidatus Neomarinimicrobiota bacterium]
MPNRRKISKFLSYVLRHNPGKIGLSLDPAGWAPVPELLKGARKNGIHIGLDDVKDVIAQSDKTRFTISEDDQYIRATYGHSIDVDLDYEPLEPPATLYHGTARRNIEPIRKNGIRSQNRQFVHLSQDTKSAKKVGSRHGKPEVLTISAKQMKEDGFTFYQSDAGIWLTKKVPASYITFPEDINR